jgi:hypothetical protein
MRERFSVYTGALLMLEKSGQELAYFVEMQKDDQLAAQKRQVLEKIIERIQNGKRMN